MDFKEQGALWAATMRLEWAKYWFYLICQLACFVFAIYSIPYSHSPWPGIAVAVIAVLAALMSVHPEMKPRHKFIYFLLMAALLAIEFRAMRKDRHEAALAEAKLQNDQDSRLERMLEGEKQATHQMLIGEQGETRALIEQENKKFDAVLKQDQREFASTLNALLQTHSQDNQHFEGVLEREENLFRQQQDLSEQISGRLISGDQPTPLNACSNKGKTFPPNAITTIAGDNAFVNFNPSGAPITGGAILTIGNRRVIGFDVVPATTNLALSIDFRDVNNRVLLRVDKNGVVNRSPLILLHPGKSRFLIQDEYGNDFLDINYINSRTFGVTGQVVYCGRTIPIAVGRDNCMASGGSSVIEITEPACPRQP